jgi:hypothetical protein
VRLDFIAPEGIKDEIIARFIGRQIHVNKIERFEFLLKHRIIIEIKGKTKKQTFKINCPKPSAFLYHKGATFIDREDEQKQAKDLYYMYFILRYTPDLYTILKEVSEYKKQGYFKEMLQTLNKYFGKKTSQGCLMVEKENGLDPYVDDLRQDIFDRFKQLRDSI